ncbi:MAG: tol-pal system protein YbgF [Bosea sp. (in: a-proteobacteria)]|uniref:tol-pal system protein YbgF n=2 Tax=Bosea sp. (in: a-proteobacteria) TaxID=1871050 RepID=UPI0027364691|nr:tol-pal system protein YbgF [Bosea sp. (in: a-proteobacteria)]MDP3603967.1 tol-pal system protein YbgF [Bosea sp. (in: a-proteobacteria)]
MSRIHAPAWKLRSCLAALALGTAVSCLSLPAAAQDAADLVVRTSRMENQIRQLSGQIEQLQFENRRLSEQLRKFQEDVEFRLNERGGARPSGAAAPGGAAPAAGAPRPQRRGDAFDPSTQVGSAGAPRPLNGGIGGIIEEDATSAGQGPLDLQGVGRGVPAGALPQTAPRGPSVAAASGPATAKEAYDVAYAAILRKEYEQAEMGFRQFLQSYPRDRLAIDATYWLGESYLQRKRYREAAEQFLKVSSDAPKSAKAPESLLRLGIALNGLGARDQACATYAKVGVDYPAAPNSVRQGVERERRRSGCA